MTSYADSWSRPRAGTTELTDWYYLGRGAMAHADWRSAHGAFTQAAAQLRDRDERPLLWLCQIGLTALAWRAGDGSAALQHAHEARALADRLSGPWPQIWSLWLLGHLHAWQQRRVDAGVCFSAARELTDTHDQEQQTMANLAAVAAMQCAAEDPWPERLAEQLFGLVQISVKLGRRQGLPLDALDWHDLEPPPLRPRAGPPPPHAAAPSCPALPGADQHASHPGEGTDLRACCLGPFELWVGPTRVSHAIGARSKTLLKLILASYPAPVPAPSLMSSIWAGVAEDLARQRLHTAISELRRALRTARPCAGDLIIAQHGSYGLDGHASVWIDCIEFSQLRRAGLRYEQAGRHEEAQKAFREAAALYRGDLFEEDVYEGWPVEQRERLKREHLALLIQLCQGALRSGDTAACLSWGRRAVECDPCCEDAHRILMRCHSQLGQRAMALRQYRQCAEALRRELDAIPEHTTEELYRRLQQGLAL